MKSTPLFFALTLSATLALAQADGQDHAAHHPEGDASAGTTNQPQKAPAAAGDGFAEQMSKMQDMHRRMQAARTPAERQALMGEHMKLMQSGMDMMSRMSSNAQRGGPAPGPGDKGPD